MIGMSYQSRTYRHRNAQGPELLDTKPFFARQDKTAETKKNFFSAHAERSSSNTIQRLRISGKLRSSKVGGIHYYRYDEIEKLMDGVKKDF